MNGDTIEPRRCACGYELPGQDIVDGYCSSCGQTLPQLPERKRKVPTCVRCNRRRSTHLIVPPNVLIVLKLAKVERVCGRCMTDEERGDVK